MEKRKYTKPLVSAMTMETTELLAGSGEHIDYEDWTDVDGNDDLKPDKELWGGASTGSDEGDYWLAE